MAGEREPLNNSISPQRPGVEVIEVDGKPKLALNLFSNNPFSLIYDPRARLPQRKPLRPRHVEQVPPDDLDNLLPTHTGGVGERREREITQIPQKLGRYFQDLFIHNLQQITGSSDTNRARGLNPQYTLDEALPDDYTAPVLYEIAGGNNEILEEIQRRFSEGAETAAWDFVQLHPELNRVVNANYLNWLYSRRHSTAITEQPMVTPSRPDSARVFGEIFFMVSPNQEQFLQILLDDQHLKHVIKHELGPLLNKNWGSLYDLIQAFREDPDFKIPYEAIQRDVEFWNAITNDEKTRQIFNPNTGDSLNSAQILAIGMHMRRFRFKSDYKNIFNAIKFSTPYSSVDLYRVATHIRTSEGEIVKLTRRNGHNYDQELMAHIAVNTTKTDGLVLFPTIDKTSNSGKYEALQKLIDNFVLCIKKTEPRNPDSVRRGRRRDTLDAKVTTRFMLDPSQYTAEEFEKLGRLAYAILKGDIAMCILENKIHAFTTRLKWDGNQDRVYPLSLEQIYDRLFKRDTINRHDEPVFKFLLMCLEFNEQAINDPQVSQIIRTLKRFNTGHISERPERLKEMAWVRRVLPQTVNHVTVATYARLFAHIFTHDGVRRDLLVGSVGTYNPVEDRYTTFTDMAPLETRFKWYSSRRMVGLALRRGRDNPRNILAEEAQRDQRESLPDRRRNP